ncbi:hypothetical protein [Streptomyces sp. NPDC057428]|uniref:hypothetical protein n=1 Tax=Streptomyces sp. NPDC057428 TaxID=3346129 RepID=UPI0036CEE493
MDYAYDAVGRRTRRTTPTGQVTTYAYDNGGRPGHLIAGVTGSASPTMSPGGKPPAYSATPSPSPRPGTRPDDCPPST